MTYFAKKKVISQKSTTDLTSTNSRITNLENNEYKVTYYEIISGASGSVTLPTGATINAGEFGLSGNCILSKIDGSNKPTFESPTTSGGTVVTATLNESTGAWVASGTYTDSDVALIYSIKIKAVNYSNLDYDFIIETVEDNGDFLNKNNNLSELSNAITARNNILIWDLFITTGNQATTSNVATNITGLVTPTLTANKRYKITGHILIGCNNSGGVKLQVIIPTSSSVSIGVFGNSSSSTSFTSTGIVASATLSGAIQTTNGANYFYVTGEVSLSSTSGTIQFGFASTTNSQTSTVYQLGSHITITQIN